MFPFRCICVDPWVWGEIVEIVMHFNYGYMCCCMYMGDSLQWAVWVCVLGVQRRFLQLTQDSSRLRTLFTEEVLSTGPRRLRWNTHT